MNANIEQLSAQINDYIYSLYARSEDSYNRVNTELESYNEALNAAKADGDLRENSAYEQAVKDVQAKANELSNYQIKMSAIDDIKEMISEYHTSGRVESLTTVYLEKEGKGNILDAPDSMYFKLCPFGLSDADNHILAMSSRMGQTLLGKKMGDIIKMRDRESGQHTAYKIVSLY